MVVFLSHDLTESFAEEVHCLRISFEFTDKIAIIGCFLPKVAPMLTIAGFLEVVRKDDVNQLLKSTSISSIPFEKGIFLKGRQLSL